LEVFGLKILIDPGHGGSDPGVTARTGQREDRTNLNVALYVMAGLEASGHTVIMTRTAHDQSVSVTARQTLIKKYKPDLVISIHHNGSASVKSNGAEICVQINNLT
jgi:N-acetylmuramoyl-L-alanine amidase